MEGLKINAAFLTVAIMLFVCQATTNLHPVILRHGNGGTQLEARLTDDYKPSSLLCNHWPNLNKKDKDGWFRLWLDASMVLDPFTKCFAERMMLHYDPNLDDYYNAPGVETRVPNFGSTQAILYLAPDLMPLTAYTAPLVESLEKLGYVDGQNLFGAPYDFRYGSAAKGHPSRVGSKFLDDLKQLIDNASSSNGGKPVIVLSHNLGGLYFLQLLNRNSVSWRKKYVKHFIAISAPWGGTAVKMLAFASGYNLGIPFENPLPLREEQRSSESNLWLMPSPKVFAEKPLVISQNATYTANDISQFLEDIGAPEKNYLYESRVLPLVKNLAAPEVPVTCIIGSGVRTMESFIYRENGFDEPPDIVYGEGDGEVNMNSLLAVESEWEKNKNQSLKVIKVPGVSHLNLLQDVAALESISEEIYCINSQDPSSFVSYN